MINQDIRTFSNQLKKLEIQHEIVEHEQFSDYKDFLSSVSATLAEEVIVNLIFQRSKIYSGLRI